MRTKPFCSANIVFNRLGLAISVLHLLYNVVLLSGLTPAAFAAAATATASGFFPLGIINLRAVASLPSCFYLVAGKKVNNEHLPIESF